MLPHWALSSPLLVDCVVVVWAMVFGSKCWMDGWMKRFVGASGDGVYKLFVSRVGKSGMI